MNAILNVGCSHTFCYTWIKYAVDLVVVVAVCVSGFFFFRVNEHGNCSLFYLEFSPNDFHTYSSVTLWCNVILWTNEETQPFHSVGY